MEKEPILKLSLQEEKSPDLKEYLDWWLKNCERWGYRLPKVCETCKYEDYGIFEEPCRSCIIETNSNWEPKDAD